MALGAFAFLTLAAAGCSLIEGNKAEDASGVGARSVVLTTELGPLAQRNLVPTSAREIRARVPLNGVSTGMRVTARWFQLGVANVPPEGQEISEGQVTLDAQAISPTGETFVRFRLTSGPNGFPEDAWLLRIYVNGVLVRTSAFVVTASATLATPQQEPTSGETSEAGATPTPVSYIVVTGDTLEQIAQRFLPEGEPLDEFLTRITELNHIATSIVLQVGQILLIPGPQ